MKKISGIVNSKGIAIAKCLYYESEPLPLNFYTVKDPEKEIQRVNEAYQKVEANIKQIIAKLSQDKKNIDLQEIMEAHALILLDEAVKNGIFDILNKEHKNAEYAVKNVMDHYIKLFSEMEDPYFKERSADVKDVFEQVLKALSNQATINLATIDYPCIIVATDIVPSITAQFNPKYIKGMITSKGSATSHSAIIANNLAIPLVTNIHDLKKTFENVTNEIILNGLNGSVIIDPDAATLEEQKTLKTNYEAKKAKLNAFADQKALSKDGVEIPVRVNIGCFDDYNAALKYSQYGVGLYRTELTFMESKAWPTCEEQKQSYEKVLSLHPDQKVVIRTLDIGGDKNLSYHQFDHEDNPFLGYRAIRFCLGNVKIFKTQIKAMLLANQHGNLHIMLPMIATLEEVYQAKKLIKEVEKELLHENATFSYNYKVGIMIETPASIFIVDKLAQELDFFSVGSNDLIQYILACDRMNVNLSYMYNSLNPAVLHAIYQAAHAAKKHGISFAVCGAMGGETLAIPFLIGCNVNYVSVALNRILPYKYLLSHLNVSDCEALVQKMLSSNTLKENLQLVKQFLENRNIDVEI